MTDELTAEQAEAIQPLVETNRGALIGAAGCGKTFSMKKLSDMLVSKGFRPILCAPTHKAAKVLSVKTDRPVTTVHSTLKLVPVPNYKDGKRVLKQVGEPDLSSDSVLIVDEASMLSPMMMDVVLDNATSVIFVGDDAQLPPVGYNDPVFLQYPCGPVAKLTTIMRQAGENPLPHVAKDWRPGGPQPKWPTQDTLGEDGGVRVMRRKDAMAQFLDEAEAHAKALGTSDEVCPALCYTNAAANTMGFEARRRIFGNHAYTANYLPGEMCVCVNPVIVNDEIVLPASTVVRLDSAYKMDGFRLYDEDWPAYMVNFTTEDGASMEAVAMSFNARDALLKIAKLEAVKKMPGSQEARQAWEEYHEIENEVLDLRSVYASTTHKSQGSTFRNVYIDQTDLMNPYADRIRRALVYTAMTRASHIAHFMK